MAEIKRKPVGVAKVNQRRKEQESIKQAITKAQKKQKRRKKRRIAFSWIKEHIVSVVIWIFVAILLTLFANSKAFQVLLETINSWFN